MRKNADRMGEQFEEMSGWNADLRCFHAVKPGITEEHHYTLMGDLEGK
jgi:hypothetical protein